MSTHSDPHRFRKTVAGIGMVAAPLLFLASAIVSPRLESEEGAQLAVVAGDMDRWFASSMLGVLSLLALVPAILGLMHMLRERESGLGHVGGGLALLGAMLTMGGAAISLVVWQMAAAGADQAEMADLYARLHDTAGVAIPFFFGGFALAAGLVALCAGLVRAKAVHAALALSLAAGACLFAVGAATYSAGVVIVAAVLATIGLVPIGRQVLAESTEDWEHTPEVGGFHPLAGH
jgi:hypothetical protein